VKSVAALICLCLLACVAQAGERTLQISVRHATAATIQQETIAAREQTSARTQHMQTYATAEDIDANVTGVTRVLVREGGEVFLDTSITVPQFAGAVVEARSSGASRTVAGIGMRELHNGFHISPRVSGSRVVLEISMQQEHAEGEAISTQHTSSRISGELGRWLRVDSSNGETHRKTVNGNSLSTREDELEWWVRVDEVKE
jgi:hypothetical protein